MDKIDKHLNLFWFYGESSSDSDEKLENNLTRGLALCLKYEPLFLNEFLAKVDHEYPEKPIPTLEKGFVDIDIQVGENKFDSSAERIIAIPITAKDFPEEDYDKAPHNGTSKPIIDMVIRYGEIAIICEVKRTEEDCLGQLKNQVLRYKGLNESVPVTYCSVSWKKISAMLEKVYRLKETMGMTSIIVRDYLQLLKLRFPSWHPINKLHTLVFCPDLEYLKHQIEQRLIVSCQKIDILERTDFTSRISFKLDWNIATEFLIEVNLKNAKNFEDENAVVEFCFWAGDTKRQGEHLFAGTTVQELLSNRKIEISDKKYQIKSTPYFKFASWQKSICSYRNLPEDKHSYFNSELFKKVSGRKKRDDWDQVDSLISTIGSNWKEEADWVSTVVDSNRTQVDISMGIEVRVQVPLIELREADKTENGLEGKLRDIIKKLNDYYGKVGY